MTGLPGAGRRGRASATSGKHRSTPPIWKVGRLYGALPHHSGCWPRTKSRSLPTRREYISAGIIEYAAASEALKGNERECGFPRVVIGIQMCSSLAQWDTSLPCAVHSPSVKIDEFLNAGTAIVKESVTHAPQNYSSPGGGR